MASPSNLYHSDPWLQPSAPPRQGDLTISSVRDDMEVDDVDAPSSSDLQYADQDMLWEPESVRCRVPFYTALTLFPRSIPPSTTLQSTLMSSSTISPLYDSSTLS
jgi:hypothetical protein